MVKNLYEKYLRREDNAFIYQSIDRLLSLFSRRFGRSEKSIFNAIVGVFIIER